MRTTPDPMTRFLTTAALLAALLATAGCSTGLRARSPVTGAREAHPCADFACEH